MAISKFSPHRLNRLYELGRRIARREGWSEDQLHTAGLMAVAKHSSPESRLKLKDDKNE